MTEIIINVFNNSRIFFDGVYKIKSPLTAKQTKEIIEDTSAMLDEINSMPSQDYLIDCFKSLGKDYLIRTNIFNKKIDVRSMADVLDFICETRQDWSYENLNADNFDDRSKRFQ